MTLRFFRGPFRARSPRSFRIGDQLTINLDPIPGTHDVIERYAAPEDSHFEAFQRELGKSLENTGFAHHCGNSGV